jgi:uncharacterized protein YbbK (DUF523 family)
MLLVSRCLIGDKCRYNGEGKPNQAVIDFLSGLQIGRDYLLICPETSGGLPIPRKAGEISNGSAQDVWNGKAKVLNPDGDDYTPGFLQGARLACEIAKKSNAVAALLKEKSPSCGVRFVHDGSFGGGILPGMGVTSLALSKLGVQIFSEKELAELKDFLAESAE